MEFNSGNLEESFELVRGNFNPPNHSLPFSKILLKGILEKKETLDHLITTSSKNWRLERMSHVDRNILRLAVFEMLYMKEVPPKVSMDEAVELGKEYGTEESGAFINGVLDNIYNQLEKEGKIETATAKNSNSG